MKFIIFLIFISHLLNAQNADVFHDFDRLVFWGREKFLGENEKDYELFKKIYLERIDHCFLNSSAPTKIPKVIHYVWLGPKPFPEKSIAKVRSWMEHHPDWVFKFWTDSLQRPVPVAGMQHHLIDEIAMQNRGFYLQSANFGEKSDIFRYEILYLEGGVYVDHDIFCYRSFEAMNQAYDFYTFMEMPHINPMCNVLFFPSNGLIGTVAQHPILSRTREYVRERWEKANQLIRGENEIMKRVRVMYRTFHSFYLAVHDFLDDSHYVNMIFPPSCVSSVGHGKFIDYSVLFCDHSYDGTWMEDISSPARKR